MITKKTHSKIEAFAIEWLQKTHRESLTETLQGFDFVEDCYRDLTDKEKTQITITQFLDLLQGEIALRF